MSVSTRLASTGRFGRLIRLVLFGASVWLILTLLDGRLADQAEAVVAAAQADWQRHQSGRFAPELWLYQTPPLEADVCNTLSGGLWLGFLMPRSSRVAFPDGLRLEQSRSGRCSRSQRTVLVITAG